jgi:Domain of unknown function (DUF4129)
VSRPQLLAAALAGVLTLLPAVPMAAVAAPAPGPAAGPPPAAPIAVEYVHLAGEAAAALQATPPDPAAARAAVGTAERLVPAGQTIGLAAVDADLGDRPPRVADALSRLRAIAVVLELPPGTRPGDDAEARRRLDDVYRRPVFAHLDQPPQPSLLAEVVDLLRRLVGRAGGTLGRLGSALAGGAVVVVAVLLTLRLVHGASARRRRVVGAAPGEPGPDADAEWSAAVAAAARGDHREAVRRAFRSALLDVTQRGRMAVDASWTTRELLACAAADADLRAVLAPAAAAFDHAWYSGRPVAEAEWSLARDRCAAVRRLAGAAPVAA